MRVGLSTNAESNLLWFSTITATAPYLHAVELAVKLTSGWDLAFYTPTARLSQIWMQCCACAVVLVCVEVIWLKTIIPLTRNSVGRRLPLIWCTKWYPAVTITNYPATTEEVTFIGEGDCSYPKLSPPKTKTTYYLT